MKAISHLASSEECDDVLLGEGGVPTSSVIAEAIAPELGQNEQLVIEFVTRVSGNYSALNPADPVGSGEIISLAGSLVEEVCYGSKTADEVVVELYKKRNAILLGGYFG